MAHRQRRVVGNSLGELQRHPPIEELIEHVRRTVLDVHGVELVHEVKIIGEVPA